MAKPPSNRRFWENAWRFHLANYLSGPPRAGYWLLRQFGRQPCSVLEIAGGSCRDSRLLAQSGWKAIGTDYEERTVRLLAEQFPDSPLQLAVADAFMLPFDDRTFEVTFHNGFWVCFQDEAAIRRLLREQLRVTRGFAVFIEHNAVNTRQVRRFAEKAASDPIYDIRAYTPTELRDLVLSCSVEASCCALHKFGGVADLLYARRIKGLPNVLRILAPRLAPMLYAWQPWQWVERVACVVDVERLRRLREDGA